MTLANLARKIVAARFAAKRHLSVPQLKMSAWANPPNLKLLVLGAGATGGYYGGKLAAAGRDVTFLVRGQRAKDLDRVGLTIESSAASIKTNVRAVTHVDRSHCFDVVLLSCKAYDLDTAIAAIAPAVGPTTLVLPILNGMRHLDQLDAAFGRQHVLGGTCHISTTLTDTGIVRHMSPFDTLTLGPRDQSQAKAAGTLQRYLRGTGFEVRHVRNGTAAMWDKWVLLATLAGATCLMRGSIGDIVARDGGEATISAMLDECCAVAAAHGHKPKPTVVFLIRATLTDPNSKMTSSMLRDLQRGARIEADHIIGDLMARGRAAGVATPWLSAAYASLSGDLRAHEPATAANLPPQL
jgi:2-dehydropantoate 2-reductase